MQIGFPYDTPKINQSVLAISTKEHHDFIKNVLKGKHVVIEIGAGIGKITELISEQVDMVYAIDHWEEKDGDERSRQIIQDCYDVFCVNCWDYRLKILPVVGLAEIAVPWLKEKGVKPDAIYIDGSHTRGGFLLDLKMCSTLFPNAMLCGDDYRWGDTMPIYIGLEDLHHIEGYSITTYPGGMWTAIRA